MNPTKLILITAISLISLNASADQLYNDITDPKIIAADRVVIQAEVEAGNAAMDLPLNDIKNDNYEIKSLRYYLNEGSCSVSMEVRKIYPDGPGPLYRSDVDQLTDDISYGSKCLLLTDKDGDDYTGMGMYSMENQEDGATYQNPQRIPLKNKSADSQVTNGNDPSVISSQVGNKNIPITHDASEGSSAAGTQ